MEEPRPILYGVSDYAEIRKANAWFVDRTAKLRDLEKVRYAMFLRPRRFGKSKVEGRRSIVEGQTSILSTFQPFNRSTGGAAVGGSVTLHRLVLVFRGGDCILGEEV